MRKTFLLVFTALVLLAGLAIGFGTRVGQAQDLEAQTRNGPERAMSYINPDTGLATENPNVNDDSECRTPDQRDRQQVSTTGSVANNVHNDACLFANGRAFDGKVSFELVGAGTFNACPDPDGAGPKTGVIKKQGKRCFLTGYQETGMAGDREYHARINHVGRAASSKVTFCFDPNDNGCKDAKFSDRIQVDWTR